jgi:hypothetical protein
LFSEVGILHFSNNCNGPLWQFCVKWKHMLEKSETQTNMAERNTNAIQNTQMFRPFNR